MPVQDLHLTRLAVGGLIGLILAGCGGGGGGDSSGGVAVPPPAPAPAPPPTTYSLGGTVFGLLGQGLVIQDLSGGAVNITASGAFTLPNRLPAGTTYAISIASQPSNPAQTCSVANPTGTVQANVSGITVNCVTPLTSRLLDLASGEIDSVTPDISRHRIYLAAPDRNEIIVLDADSYLVLDHYFVGSAPKAVALSADASKLYVGLYYGGALVVVDLNTRTMTTIPVAAQLGTPIVRCLAEVRPGIVLVGGSSVWPGPVNLITVDLTNGAAQQIVATQLPLTAAFTFVKSPDGGVVFGLGLPHPTTGSASAQIMFRIDATQPGLPIVASVAVNSVSNVAVSQDGKYLLTNAGELYDAVSLQRLSSGNVDGSVSETPDGAVIMQAIDSTTWVQRDGIAFGLMAIYHDDCPAGGLLGAIAPAQLRGEWIKLVGNYELCAVSTTTPATAPGVSGSRALPPWIPDPVLMPWVEVPDGVVADIAIDNVRGMAYTSNFTGQSVDIYSFASQTIVGSIPVGGSPQRLTLSADGNTLYAGVFYQGEVVAIDLTSRTVTARATLTSLLGSTNVWSIAEISPGHLLVGALPEQLTGPNTYLVDVMMSNPSSAQRVGCPLGYYTPKPVISPDKHFLYLLDVTACPPEKRDLTLPGYPVVRSGPPGGYLQGGTPVITADGAHLICGGTIIDTSTLQQTAYTGSSSLALPSQNPDRFYVFGLQAIVTIELHDLKILSIAQNGCQVGAGIDGFSAVAMSADEKTFITINSDVADLCVTQLAP